MKLVLPLPAPSNPLCSWWGVGVLDENGNIVEARNLIVPETRLGDAIVAARWVMQVCESEHVVITSGEPEHETLYEEKRGEVLVNRLGA